MVKAFFLQRYSNPVLTQTLLLVAMLSPMSGMCAAELEQTQVYISNGQLEYVGELNAAANQRLFDLYEKVSPKPTVLAIRSPGGEVNAGMSLGTWVHARALHVQVLEFCLSSCANYVFPAGNQKILSNFAVIGYHGGPGDPAKLAFDAPTQAMYDSLDAAQQKAFMDGLAKLSGRDGQREAEYYRQLGVRSDISSLGQDSQFDALNKANPDAAGWTYTLEGFSLLGVRNVSVINPPWKPAIFNGMRFITIPVSKRASD